MPKIPRAPTKKAITEAIVNPRMLNQDLIDCVLEIDGSYKIGHYIPGTKIPILSEKILTKNKPDYLPQKCVLQRAIISSKIESTHQTYATTKRHR